MGCQLVSSTSHCCKVKEYCASAVEMFYHNCLTIQVSYCVTEE